MLRVVFLLSAALYLLSGLLLYFTPPGGLAGVLVNPLWVARVAGAVLFAWGVQLLLASSAPNGRSVAGFVVGNLLVAATLAPAALAPGATFGVLPRLGPLGCAVLLALLAVLALVAPRERRL